MSYLDEEKVAKIERELSPLPQAFDLLSDHIVITDIDGVIVYANKGVEANTGYSISLFLF